MIRKLISVLSVAVIVNVVRFADADIDYSVCNPLNVTVPTPMPALAESFTAHIEWKWMERNLTIDVTEVQNGILKMGSQVIEMEGAITKILIDYTESQYITYTKKDGCKVEGLGTFAYYNNMLWLQATPMLYNIAKLSGAMYQGTFTRRNTTVGMWRTCLDIYQFNITVEVDIYYSANDWGMAMSAPNQMIPVQIEMRGSQNSTGGYTRFHVIGDYVDYNPFPTLDESQLQLPAGVYCNGRASRKPLDLLPESFSLVMEKIDQDYHRVEYQYIWYDGKNRLIRMDTKPALNIDPDPTAEIFDFNLGVHYSIDKYMGNCEPCALLSYGDRFVMPLGNATRMESSLEFFHVKNAFSQFVGARTTRGVACDVWVGVYLDPMAGTNFTIEWYFTQREWFTAIGGVIQTNTLFRMDIWEGGSNKPTIYNVLQLDKDSPSLSAFDISPCYSSEHKARILLHMAVSNQGKLSTVGKSYLSDSMHIQLTKALLIPPLRITDLSVFVAGDSDLYVDFIMLDNAPLVNTKIVPPPPKQHPLSGVLDFLKGRVLGGLSLSFNSTTSKTPVVVKSQAVQEINYVQRFTTTTSLTTSSGSPATPPTAPPLSPSILTPPTPGTTTLLTPPSLPPPTSQQTPCPQCICSKQTCPTCSPRNCPVGTNGTCAPCPKATPQPCKQCSYPTCAPCPVVTKQKCPQCTQTTCAPCHTQCPKCPTSTSTPCPSQKPYHIPTPALQTSNNDDSGSKGVSAGVVVAIAISTLIVGLVLGVVFLRMYQRYLQATGSERKTILDNYLNDNERY